MLGKLPIFLLTCNVFAFASADLDETNIASERAGCTMDLNKEVYTYLPLLLNPHRTGPDDAFVLPVDKTGTLSFKSKETVEIQCPGGSIRIADVKQPVSVAVAVCSTGNQFKILSESVPLTEITCTKYPAHEARYTGKTCNGGAAKEIAIGFPLTDDEFLTHITTCFDGTVDNSLYSTSKVSHAIGGYQSNYPRPDFIEGEFYHLDGTKLNTLYTRNRQRETINGQLGLPPDDYTYVHKTNDYYLARGHLAAKTDLVYGSQQRLTFYYVNAAPQWQTLNAGNWLTLEENVRDYASDNGLDLIVYTGTHGVATLPHRKTGNVDLFLYYDQNGNGRVPVPQHFWKVVYEPISKRGVAFVAVNNPYDGDDVQFLCTNVSAKIDWLTWKPHDVKSGLAYGCEVDDFRKAVAYLPKFKVSGLLQ